MPVQIARVPQTFPHQRLHVLECVPYYLHVARSFTADVPISARRQRFQVVALLAVDQQPLNVVAMSQRSHCKRQPRTLTATGHTSDDESTREFAMRLREEMGVEGEEPRY